jgi:hypothetical protein
MESFTIQDERAEWWRILNYEIFNSRKNLDLIQTRLNKFDGRTTIPCIIYLFIFNAQHTIT